MTQKNIIYSDYVIKKAQKTKLTFKPNDNGFLINGKYNLRFNKKTKRFQCTCRYAADGKTRDKCCSHELGLYWHLDRVRYDREIEKNENN